MLERQLRILIAEDYPPVLLSIRHMLEDAGYIAEGALSGDIAMTRLSDEDEPIDLLITDIRLGKGVDGWAVAEHGRWVNPRLAVLYISGDCQDAFPALGVGGALMLAKPLHRSALLSAIDRLSLDVCCSGGASPALTVALP